MWLDTLQILQWNHLTVSFIWVGIKEVEHSNTEVSVNGGTFSFIDIWECL